MTKADYDELVRLRETEYGDEINYIARDENCELYFYQEKPTRSMYVYGSNGWLNTDGCGFGKLDEKTFPSLKWEDDPIGLAAAIAEYERAQEGKSGTDASKPV